MLLLLNLMKSHLLFFALLLLLSSPSLAQEDKASIAFNQVDAANRKQGVWQYFDNNLNLVLECPYKDNRPVGLLKYYKENKLVLEYEYPEKREKQLWTYYENGEISKGYSITDKNRTTHYFENGKILTADQVQDILSHYETEVAFEGGYKGLQAYLIENLKYPEKARKKGIEGEVYISFVVNKLGGIREVALVMGVDELIDQEAIRLVEQMPKWTPATLRGYPKEVRHTLIIPFKPAQVVAGIRE
jgi:TonB family protein